MICGRSPVDFSIAASSPAAEAIPGIPASLPSELLEHRPDIAAAERRMAAANADIGVAKAAFFPTVRINGLAGFQSIDSSTWFNWPSRFWSVGPSVQLPLFTGGLNRAKLAFAHAAYDEMVADYRQTVLDAFGEVEDALAAQHLLTDEWNAENDALSSSRHALEIANNRYKSGLVTYLDVATAQTDALNHEQATVQLTGARPDGIRQFDQSPWLRLATGREIKIQVLSERFRWVRAVRLGNLPFRSALHQLN